MGTFSITQSDKNMEKLYIYPNNDLSGCTVWTANGGGKNCTYVDEDRKNPDYSTTYISIATDAYMTDLYEIPNQSCSGTIEYVKLNTVARNVDPPLVNFEFYLVVSPDSVCTHVYLSDPLDITSGWFRHQWIWATNPSTSTTWSWADIDAMSIGVKGKCGEAWYSTSTVLRPNEAGDETDLTPYGSANNWENVVTSDYGNRNYIGDGGQDTDLYHLNSIPTTTTPIIITSIDTFIYAYLKGSYCYPEKDTAAIRIKEGGTLTGGDSSSGGGSPWVIFSQNWATNPRTSTSWTWTQVNNLQLGADIDSNCNTPSCGSPNYTCTAIIQVYAVVNYNTYAVQEMQASQVYAEVGYTPSTTTCYLNMPSEISSNHTRNTKMFNFWNGEREVYDHSRSRKSLVLTGKEWYNPSTCTNPCSRITCVRNMGRNGASVTLDGFSFGLWEGTYKIKQFGWQKISNRPEVYDWILELEDES